MKHAYLILAHKNDYTFFSLLKCIDYEENDIFIHMDSKNRGYDPSETESFIKHSSVYHSKSIRCTWGAYSIIKAEVGLLELAVNTGHYSFYHLISGADLPIKPQQTIHEFFDANQGKEFLRFNHPDFRYDDRVRYYHFLQGCLGRKGTILKLLEKNLQKCLGIRRNRNTAFQKGTNWFSVTDSFARYIVSRSEWIRSVFRYTDCADEIFVHTLLLESPFVNNLYHPDFDNDCISIMRFIDWERGCPYVFRNDDYQEILDSPYMFARKFDASVDKAIIDRIAAYVLPQ